MREAAGLPRDAAGRPRLRARLVAVSVAVGLAAGLAACDSGTAVTTTPTPTVPTTGTVVPMGMRIDTSKGTVAVHAYESPAAPGAGATPFAGDVFAVADVEACGGANADQSTGIVPTAFHLELGHFVAHPSAKVARQPALGVTRLGAGQCVRGWITFEIPAGAKADYVIFTGTKVVAWRVP